MGEDQQARMKRSIDETASPALQEVKAVSSSGKVGGEEEPNMADKETGQLEIDIISADESKQSVSDTKTAVFWFTTLALVSVWMTVGNKIVMTTFNYPNYVGLLQNSSAVICLIGANLCGLIQIKPTNAQQWKIFLVNAALLVAQIVTSLKALPLVAIATTIAFKNLVTCLTAVTEAVFFGKKFSGELALAMLVTTAGMSVYAGSDINFNATGYFWLVMNTLSSVGNALWNKFYISKFTKSQEQTAEGITLIQQAETLPLMIMMATYNSEWEAVDLMSQQTSTVLVVLFGTCIGGYWIGVCYAKVFQIASGTSVMLASTVNKAISIIVAWFVFENILTSEQIFGLFLCIFGGVWYAIASKRKTGHKGCAEAYLGTCVTKEFGYSLVPTTDLGEN